MPNFFEKIRVWRNVYRRIRYFKKMYPLSTIAKDLFLFPMDYHFGKRPITSLRNLTVAVTHRCNLRCEMCYFVEELNNPADLPFETYTRVIDEVAASKPCIILSGGEPFAHPRIVDMVAHAKSKGLATQIFTNGTMAVPAKADALADLGLDYIDFTLLGDETTHSLVACVPNAYEKFIKNLEYFSKNKKGTKIVLNYTVTPRAIQTIGHAIELVKRFDLDGLRVQHYNFLRPKEFEAHKRVMDRVFGMPVGANETGLSDSLDGMADALEAFAARVEAELPGIPVQWAPSLTPEELRTWYGDNPFRTDRTCLFPWRGVILDADGKLYPCSKIYMALGDVNEQQVFDIWNNESAERFRDHLKKNLYPACSRCCKL